MVRVGGAIVFSIMVATSSGAEQLPSILSAEGQAFLMGLGPVAADDDPVVTPETPVETPMAASSSGGKEVKSTRRAFLYSVLVPGLGEWYAGAKTRGLVFFGIEAVALGVWSSWIG